MRKVDWPGTGPAGPETLLAHEWLVTNGLGGYASGTVCGIPTRRFHGVLVAALPAPHGRTMTLNHLVEEVRADDGPWARLGAEETEGAAVPPDLGATHLREFRLEAGLPAWTFDVEGIRVEKRLVIPHLQNTVYLVYTLLGGARALRLRVRPAVHFRPHEAPLDSGRPLSYALTVHDGRYEISSGTDLPPLRLRTHGPPPSFTFRVHAIPEVVYRVEEHRGYDARGALWSPGYFSFELRAGERAAIVASTERWGTIDALDPDRALETEMARRRGLVEGAGPAGRDPTVAELVVAADQFIITPVGRVEDVARARAAGDDVRTVIAGYHWFTDWGRDTMISLEGLTLSTGRHVEAGWILRTFAHYVRDGLIPNMFPEGENRGLYHTADATLWFFHALERYVAVTGDRATLRLVLPTMVDIVEHHLRGTHFGIRVDAEDGLLRQGAEGYQLTWMDAKCEGWVVTPRRGKAVEINALWYNALRLLQGWLEAEGMADRAAEMGRHADRVRSAFNARFWYAEGRHLYDVVDGEDGRDDPALRPNQLLAISLDHPVLDEERWRPVMEVVRARLLTPVGLRSLGPGHPDYKARYYGDLRSRDAAYHQGTVWGWLIGPYVDAWLRTFPDDRAGARRALEGFVPHLGEACIGTISEVFDADEPFTPRGCAAQAWSVAEVLRCWLKTGAGSGR
ncbi:MAG TPA: amylo-alpha-1,6-glucosidase [Vicinamibacteria bacterium]|nr:amylo-alpha-1,6-glucosidase [Vicinamibacteria bacterium]